MYEEMADKVADAFAIPRSLFRALIQTESGWNPYAIGSKGEIGLTQLMPGTASDLGVNAWDAEQNLKGGATYLSTQFKRFGNWATALAAYNAGPGNVKAGQEYATTVLHAQIELQKANPSLDQAPAAPEQDWYRGSVLEQILNWVTGSGQTPIGKSPEPGAPNYDPDHPTIPKPTPEQSASFGQAAGTFGKYALGTLFVIVSVGIAVYVLATAGTHEAIGAIKKNVS